MGISDKCVTVEKLLEAVHFSALLNLYELFRKPSIIFMGGFRKIFETINGN